MELQSLKCPNCGALLNGKYGQKLFHCSYCGSTIIEGGATINRNCSIDERMYFFVHQMDEGNIETAYLNLLTIIDLYKPNEKNKEQLKDRIQLISACCDYIANLRISKLFTNINKESINEFKETLKEFERIQTCIEEILGPIFMPEIVGGLINSFCSSAQNSVDFYLNNYVNDRGFENLIEEIIIYEKIMDVITTTTKEKKTNYSQTLKNINIKYLESLKKQNRKMYIRDKWGAHKEISRLSLENIEGIDIKINKLREENK